MLTLGIVADSPFVTRVLVLSGIALLMTVGVYGLVAGIVKLDDAGFYLMRTRGENAWAAFRRWVGERLVSFAPWLMKALGVVGTIAMFMVGGGILVHGIHSLDVAIKDVAQQLDSVATIGPALATLTPTLGGVLVGVVAGALAVGAVTLWQKVVPGR